MNRRNNPLIGNLYERLPAYPTFYELVFVAGFNDSQIVVWKFDKRTNCQVEDSWPADGFDYYRLVE